MKYSAKIFRDNLPEWKKKKDSWLVRNLYRPCSFYTAAWFCNRGINANQVSFISLLLTFPIAIFFITGIYQLEIIAALLVSVWMVLDCTDGNIARTVKSLPYGEFIDAIAGYFCVDSIMISVSLCAYKKDGVIFGKQNIYLVIMGLLSATCDSLARLCYQKFMNLSWMDNNTAKADLDSKGRLYKIHDRIDKEIGLNGILIPFLTLSAIFGIYDVFLIIYALYYFVNLLGSVFMLLRKSGLTIKIGAE